MIRSKTNPLPKVKFYFGKEKETKTQSKLCVTELNYGSSSK